MIVHNVPLISFIAAPKVLGSKEATTIVTRGETELARSEKLAALGSLVAGIAHELNTPIGTCLTASTGVQSCAQAVTDEMVSERPRRSILVGAAQCIADGMDLITRSLHRAAKLVSTFKQLSVDQSRLPRRQFQLVEAIESGTMWLDPASKAKYTLKLEVPPDLMMDSYPDAIEEVLSNLISNTLLHGVERRERGEISIVARSAAAGQIEIVYTDDGNGIAQEHLGRVFDPFFTTKLGKGGSGLGMNIVYNLVTEVLGGTITVRSTPGEGVSVRILLPVSPTVVSLVRTQRREMLEV